MAKYLGRVYPEPVDKELFSGSTKGRSSQADLVMMAKFKGRKSRFLVHVEAQETWHSNFDFRLLKYYLLLYEKYHLDVYPVVVFSFNGRRELQPSLLKREFPDMEVLRFRYLVVQLNQLHWQDYADLKNPVALAFMAKMPIADKDRAHVKLRCVRLLRDLRLKPDKERIISEFIDTYLKLSKKEEKQYAAELEKLAADEREGIMPVRMSWKEQGRVEGKAEGKAEGRAEGKAEGRAEGALTIACSILNHRFGQLEPSTAAMVQKLSVDELTELSLATSEFKTVADLEAWLAPHSAKQ